VARDHRKLRVFHEAHALTLAIYHASSNFPADESFGLRSQMRRAAVSVTSNIVEGSARLGEREYVNFLNIARASAAELAYLVILAGDLSYLPNQVGVGLQRQTDNLIPQLEALIQSLNAKGQSQEPKALA
jgi:four helix bundle protein